MEPEIEHPIESVEDVSKSAESAVESVKATTEDAIRELSSAVRIHGEAHSTALGRIETQLRELANATNRAITETANAAVEVAATPAAVVADVPGVAGETVGATVENVAEEPRKMRRHKMVGRRGK